MNHSMKAPRHIFLKQLATFACNRLITAPRVEMRRPSHAGTRPSTREMNRAAWAARGLMLADPLSSNASGATVAVTGGKPFV